ncbi:MAG TPA: hypothetical protein VNX67_00455 [Solirubrobacteraceae bacterium]|jgi:hypothetical protein|nr:hypothetical protein [Solirubrobacteraceae bacterium]
METLNDYQYQVLAACNAAGQATKHELVQATALAGMTVANLLRDLETERLVAKDVDANRGTVVWQVTAHGADMLDMES